jgi:hypothetical protein
MRNGVREREQTVSECEGGGERKKKRKGEKTGKQGDKK